MKIFFNIITGFFLFFTIVVGLFFLRGNILFSSDVFAIIKAAIMPGYFIFLGLMIGYIFAILKSNNRESVGNYTKGFIIGIIIGIILALTYMFI